MYIIMISIAKIYDKMDPKEFWEDDVFYFYEGHGELYRWRRVAPNWEIVGASTEWYQNKSMCKKNAIRNGMNKEHRYEVE
jgi:uncharacterized protein YegP (UPF0339 family)